MNTPDGNNTNQSPLASVTIGVKYCRSNQILALTNYYRILFAVM